ncbi:hypothetical protein LguiA_001958 [Lonicera macranthoides]
MMNEPQPCNKLDLFLVRIQLALVVGAGTACGFCRAEETNDDNDPQKENSQQKKGQRPKHGTLEIEKEEGSTISARPSKSSTLEDLFSKCTGRRSNDSEEVSLSPLRIPPGHSAGSPTVELYRIARHERPSQLRTTTFRQKLIWNLLEG